MSKLHILLVEDNPADIDLTYEFLENSKIRNSMAAVKNGVEALAYLRGEGQYSQATRPSLVLLDLNMPKRDGHAVLEEIRKDPSLSDIFVVVLTTSREQEDMIKAHFHKADYYLCKPIDMVQLFRMVQAIEGLGFDIVEKSPAGKLSGEDKAKT